MTKTLNEELQNVIIRRGLDLVTGTDAESLARYLEVCISAYRNSLTMEGMRPLAVNVAISVNEAT